MQFFQRVSSGSQNAFASRFDEGFADALADMSANGNRQLMFQRPITDYLDQLKILQNLAPGQDGKGDLHIVVGQGNRKIGGEVF